MDEDDISFRGEGGDVINLSATPPRHLAMLNGVFDAAAESLAVPWPYLIAVLLVSVAATAVASVAAIRHARRAGVDALRAT